jgi:hypothetical protein
MGTKPQATPTLRAQLNSAFEENGHTGKLSLTKVVAFFGQVVILYNLGISFSGLIDKPETLLILISFLVAPDLIRKLVSLKYGPKT